MNIYLIIIIHHGGIGFRVFNGLIHPTFYTITVHDGSICPISYNINKCSVYNVQFGSMSYPTLSGLLTEISVQRFIIWGHYDGHGLRVRYIILSGI